MLINLINNGRVCFQNFQVLKIGLIILNMRTFLPPKFVKNGSYEKLEEIRILFPIKYLQKNAAQPG